MIECDNVSQCHNPIVIGEDENAMRIVCTNCWVQKVIRKWPLPKGVPENRAYSKVFKKDVLQGSDNLFYKYNEQHLRQ